jgi:hypothetical protein
VAVAEVRHLHPPPWLFLHPLAEAFRVRSVCPRLLQHWQPLVKIIGQERSRTVAVVEAGSVDTGAPSTSAPVSTSSWHFLPERRLATW